MRKATTYQFRHGYFFVCLSVCPSVLPHVTTRLPKDGLTSNLSLFPKHVEKIQVVLQSDKNWGLF